MKPPTVIEAQRPPSAPPPARPPHPAPPSPPSTPFLPAALPPAAASWLLFSSATQFLKFVRHVPAVMQNAAWSGRVATDGSAIRWGGGGGARGGERAGKGEGASGRGAAAAS